MKNRNTAFVALLTLAIALPLAKVSGQTSDAAAPAAPPIKVTAELVSHYVWRGSMATGSPTPNFQPTLAYSKGAIEIGVWGSTAFSDNNGSNYKEVDPYVSYTTGPWKITITDYDWNLGLSNYFNYKTLETGHMFEGTIGYTGPSSMPISVTLNTMFAGHDQKGNGNVTGNTANTIGSDSTKQAYSTYIEIGYSKGPANFFFGFTPWAGYYNNYGVTKFMDNSNNYFAKKSFSIVNIGVTLSRSVKITDAFSLPLRATFIVNPSATYSRGDYVHLVFGITF